MKLNWDGVRAVGSWNTKSIHSFCPSLMPRLRRAMPNTTNEDRASITVSMILDIAKLGRFYKHIQAHLLSMVSGAPLKLKLDTRAG